MVTIDRRLAGVLPYRTVFFPTTLALSQAVDALTPIQIARFFWTDAELGDVRGLVTHERTATICIDLARPLDAILSNMSQSTRRKLRQAEKLESRVLIARNSPTAAQDFLLLYNGLAQSKRSDVSAIGEDTLLRYAGHSDIFVTYLDGEALCGHVNLLDREAQRDRLIFSANRRFDDPETARLCAILNCHLHWHELRLYREEGLTTYDLGGFSRGTNAGIDQFKASFGGRIVDEHTYLCAGSPRLARLLEGIRNGFKRSRQPSRVLVKTKCGLGQAELS